MIKSNNRDVGLDALVDAFADHMKIKFQKKFQEGCHGWDNHHITNDCYDMLIKKAKNGKWIDVANFAAILWNLKAESRKWKLDKHLQKEWILFKDKLPKDGTIVELLLPNKKITDQIKFDDIETMLDINYCNAYAWRLSIYSDKDLDKNKKFSITEINKKIEENKEK